MNPETLFAIMIERLSERGPVRVSGKEAFAKCPAHDGTGLKTLHVSFKDGTVLTHCFSRGCRHADILDALGIDDDNGEQRHVDDIDRGRVYTYTDAGGTPLYRVVRKSGVKDFRQESYVGGRWVAGGPKKHGIALVLYNLPSIMQAKENGDIIWVVEGEKDVHTLMSLGEAATTWAGGANGWNRDYAITLKGADVIIVPDRDSAGQKVASRIIEDLKGIAKSIRRCDLKYELSDAHGKDTSDFIWDGGTVEEMLRLADESWRIGGARDWVEVLEDYDRRERQLNVRVAGLGPEWGGASIVPCTLSLMAARTGYGKTTWATDLIASAIMKDLVVQVHSLDEDSEVFGRDVAASVSGDFLAGRHRAGYSQNELMDRYGDIITKYRRSVRWGGDDDTTIEYIEEFAARNRPHIIIVDHIEEVDMSDYSRQPDYIKLKKVASRLKKLARNLGCAVVALAQMNRDFTTTTESRDASTMMAHISGSDAVGRTSSLALFMTDIPNVPIDGEVQSGTIPWDGRQLRSFVYGNRSWDTPRLITVGKTRYTRAGSAWPVIACGLERAVIPVHDDGCDCPSCERYAKILETRERGLRRIA